MTREEREKLLKRLAVTLGREFPGCQVEAEPMQADVGSIRVIRNSAEIHRVRFLRAFLEDDRNHGALAGKIASKMKAAGPEGVWFSKEDADG